MKRSPPIQKISLSLLEVLFAFTLMAILAGLLLGSYRSIVELSGESQKIRQLVLERKYTQERLGQIFGQMSHALSPGNPIFYTELVDHGTPKLHLIFDNGIDPDPLFCHGVKGTLSLEDDKLMLTVAPLSESSSVRRETLLKNLSALSFKFLDFGYIEHQKHDLWPTQNNGVPSLMVLSCQQGDQKLDFSFFLSAKSEPAIVYFTEVEMP